MKFLNYSNKTLIGIGEIAKFLRVDEMVVLDWRLAYCLPIRKRGGVFIAEKSSLSGWLRCHPDAVAEAMNARPPFEIIQHRRVKTRWGLEKIQTRLINF